nr:MAG TPA: hypothetical protein [Caudoviricetes sp.]
MTNKDKTMNAVKIFNHPVLGKFALLRMMQVVSCCFVLTM